MSSHVLIPMDGSPLSKQALEIAIARSSTQHVTVLHVIDPTEPGYSYYPYDRLHRSDDEPRHGSDEWYQKAEEFANKLFEEARERAEGSDIELDTELVVGLPSRAIVEYAREHDIDQIYLGSHGRGEDADILLGSVTEAVAFRSPVMVTLVR